ncbi:MAG: SDR family NAD(P)-dependent oxidoreductase [Oceanococcus sp.]
MQATTQFETLVLSPADAAHAGLAIAAARANGIGILDLEFVANAEQAEANFLQLLLATKAQNESLSIGLRVGADRLGLALELLANAEGRCLCFIVHGQTSSLSSLANTLLAKAATGSKVLLETSEADSLSELPKSISGVVAKGHEAGAWVGEDTSYILAQKLLSSAKLPVYLRGGLGRHSVSAAVLNGAAGVVLDDQVLLLQESPLSAAHKKELGRLNGSETQLLGEHIGMPCRVFGRRGLPVLQSLEQASRQMEAGRLAQADWMQQLTHAIGWGEDALLPLGQAVGLAAQYAQSYGSVGRLIKALREQVEQSRALLQADSHLAEASALAQSHGTRFPIAQGPMTRVSDSAEFAHAVAEGGALPFLALALMRGQQVDDLLVQTQEKLAGKPWGVGLLGFVPQALRQEQCEAVFRHQPDYALIAGGRPDQAAEFEQRGIPAYLHAPAPALLKLFLEQGARRFVFEGRECGGHIGPLASFPLWEQMIEILLSEVPADQAGDVHVLFAGGISDERSGAMIAALTASLAARGMKVGMLMGTAYLFTREIVESGAIVEGFQQEALDCQGTVSLETGPGHATRCANTEFSREFFRQRGALMQSEKSADEIRDELEDLNMGRLRVASKGRDRNEQGELVDLDKTAQYQRGMYMIGQVATLRDQVLSIEDLHRSVTDGASARLQQLAEDGRELEAVPSDIAIIGIGMIMPQIDDADGFWNKVLHQQSTITEVPKDRWDQALYFDPDKNARDKVYAKWGGFLDEIVFDPTEFGIPPNSMKSIDPMQLLSLEATARALRDARLGQEFNNDFDRENTSIILGAGGGIGDLGMQLGLRSELPRFVEDPEDAVWDRLPEWTNESFAGVLLNVTAGRIANRMDFGGLNFTVDAACGSSLAAITLATQELESGRSNVAIAGGVDTVQGPFGYLCFSKTQALSPKGRARSFDKNADGIVISEGVCVTVMKRLADAQRDGDRIYAVIKAASGSSDGRALGMTAPLPKGQQRALNRAYKKAGFSPASLGMVEAHGTGTAVGDKAEAETVTNTLIAAGAQPRSVALGSVKTLVGHTKCAAGVTGLVKTALSLYHRVLPAHYGVDQPIDVIADKAAPTYLLKQPRPWLRNSAAPRRAAVSAFGFGGTNFHAVLEEYRPGWGADAPTGAEQWPSELCVLRAADESALRQQLNSWSQRLQGPINPAARLASIAASMAVDASGNAGTISACIVAQNLTDLAEQLTAVLAHLDGRQELPSSCRLNRARPQQQPKTALLFPGQGAQYPGMGRDAAVFLPELRSAWEQADDLLSSELGEPLSAIAWPPSAFDPATESEQRDRLTQTRHAQPALGAMELGLWRWFASLGIQVDATAGHSYGEYAALMAAGVLSAEDFLKLSATRGRVMAEAAQTAPAGTMAAVMCNREHIEALIADIADVSVANHNAPEQSVITGSVEAIDAALQACEQANITARKLPVGGAFHSPLMDSAQAALSAAIDQASFAPARCAVYSNMSAELYPAEMAEHLKQHLLSPVEFVSEIRNMREAGTELFIELGPKSILSGMLRSILPDGAQRCVAIDADGGSINNLLHALSDLYHRGVDMQLSALFESRGVSALSALELVQYLKAPELPRTAWMLAGGYARRADDPIRSNGLREALSLADKQAAKQKAAATIPAALSAPQALPQMAAPAAIPSTAAVASAAPLSGEAFSAYQDTMRQFLQLQETIMAQAMGVATPQAAVQPQTAFMPAAPVVQSPVSEQADAVVPVATPAATPETVVVAETVPAEHWDAARIQAVLLDITAEKTGYPQDMLDLQADLEADLGIDSIKRVELAGALQKVLPQAMAQAMQADLESYTRAPNLQVLIDQLVCLAGEQPAVVAAAPTAAPTAPTAVAAEVIDFQSVLLDLVAEKTGYPQDMLDPQADLEADLGIDSIKRVEIVGALQKVLPAHMAEAIQSDLESYTRARSLAEMTQRLSALTTIDVVANTAATVPEAVVSSTPPPTLDMASLVVDLVAEKTGYPQDMLDPQADLEADLGIDSIKRVEIVGALQKQLPAALAAAVQNDLERYTRARSLAELVAALSALMGEQSSVAPAVPADVVAATAPALDIRQLVLDVVAEKTGYPQDMLDAQADLEADLGIDSIKRVEIVGALQKQLPDALAQSMQADLERYTRAKNLASLINEVEAQKAGTAVPVAKGFDSTSPAVVATPAPAEAVNNGVPRYVIRPRPASLPQEQTKPEGLIVLVDGPESIRLPLQERITAAGAQVVELLLDDPRAIKNELALAVTAHGPVQAVIHLGGLSAQEEGSFANWRRTGSNTVGKLFTLLKAMDEERESLKLLAATRLGGTFGREAQGEGHVLAGGAAGVINCYRQEYPDAIARTIDFDGQSDDIIAEHLYNELVSADPHREIGYLGDARSTVSTILEPLREHDFAAHLEPQAGWVVLATGGARGITAEILIRMAKPEVTYVLVGRTPLTDDADLHLEHATAIGVKGALIAEGRVNGNLPKPVEIDKQVASIMAAREVRNNLERMRQAGVNVEYLACDVRDLEQFSGLIEGVYQRHQRIDGVIHAAGVIEDKLIADKTLASFDRVFGTKTDSAWILANTLRPESLKWMAFFTSVAGRYGNRGQSDYAAANEALNRLAWQLSRRWKETRILAINWGPWDAGMASDAVKAKFREQGILPIPVETGARYFLDELGYGPKSEVELVVGDGPWAAYDQPLAELENDGDLALIRGELRMGPGGSLTLTHHFDESSDPYLADHRMDGKAVLPAAGAAEWMAQLAAAGWPGWQVAEVRDLKVLAGVVVDPSKGRDISLRAKASSHSQAGEQMLAVEMLDAQRGQVLYKCKVRLVEHLEEAPTLQQPPIVGGGMSAQTAYSDYLFHGECFQLLEDVSGLNSEGVDAALRSSRAQDWLNCPSASPWLFDPGLLDCGPQLAILWSRKHLDKTALPSAFGSVSRYGRDPLPNTLSVHLRIKGEASEQSLIYDVLFADAQGRIRIAMRDVEGTASAALNRLASVNA